MARPRSRNSYSRTDRLAETIRAIVATELERLDDDRLEMVTVTGVQVDGSYGSARVFYSALTAGEDDRLDDVAEALEDLRWPIQKVVNRSVRAKRTPQIVFAVDDVLNEALRIDDIVEGRGDQST
jgi:ribosome-binding factor A